jgi:ribosome assembly protein RRB1
VQVFDVQSQLESLQPAGIKPSKPELLQTPAKQGHTHSAEGFALDWSSHTEGLLAAGDCRAGIHVWQPQQDRWAISGAYRGHTDSVEDLQWSPSEGNVFASCSVDKTIRIWDTRDRASSQLHVTASDTDVNVIAWCKLTAYILASGDDKGFLKVWDLRSFADGADVANFTYHSASITSLEWSPQESSVLATSSSDNQLAIWDLAVERDPEEEASLVPHTNAAAPEDLPPQLMFVHGGQQDMKECHWHPQIPGMLVSTAADGFNVFKAANV